jgi:hypothetical protein
MEGLIGNDDDWVFLLLIILVGLPFLLALFQVPLAIVYTVRRAMARRPLSGWIIYWVMSITYLIYHFTAERKGMAEIPDLYFLCYVPAVWFFIAGKFSDKRSKQVASQ